MSKLFTTIRVKKPKRNTFNLSHERKFSMNMGYLTPILCQEVVPGDTFKMNSEVFMRFAPMVFPIMHRVNVWTHFFFVPNRLVFDKWQDFILGGKTGMEPLPFPMIEVTNGGAAMPSPHLKLFEVGSLPDYLGIPPLAPHSPSPPPGVFNLRINALPFRAYQLIYNEFYRDQNLHEPVPMSKDAVVTDAEAAEILQLRKRCWEKDYFTSALTHPQRGEDVLLPLGGNAPVKFTNDRSGGDPVFRSSDEYGEIAPAGIDRFGQGLFPNPGGPNSIYGNIPLGYEGGSQLYRMAYDPKNTLEADLSLATSTTVDELRKAVRLQEFLELKARSGNRYVEYLKAVFGVTSSDARLQRPEFLGGGKSPVVISEVLQTSATQDGVSAQGNMAGHGVSVGNTHKFKRYFEEHGFVIGIMSVLPRTAYHQGIPRQYFKEDMFDYYIKHFAHLGEQPVFNKELFIADDAYNNKEFGYQSRYSEYKFIPSSVHGEFRTTLHGFHMARKFDTPPALSGEFVEANPTHDIFAVTDEVDQKLWVQVFNNLRAKRPMPFYGTPRL